jgi:hypothetical protein
VAYVQNAASGIFNIVKALVPNVVNAIAGMVRGVQQWLHDRLPAIFAAPKAAVASTTAAFISMKTQVADKTVPAMVAGVKKSMEGMDPALAKPAAAATKKAADSFADLRREVQSVMDGLMTDAERNAKQLDERLATLAKARKAGIITQAEADAQEARAIYEAVRAANGPQAELKAIKIEPIQLVDSGVAKADAAIKEQAATLKEEMTKAWATVKDVGLGALQEWVNTGQLNWRRLANDLIRNWDSTMKVLGDLWNALTSSMDASKGIASAFSNGASGGKSGGGKLATLANVASAVASIFGGARAKGGPVQPGKIYMTGEKGPEPFIPRTAGTILPHGSLDGGPVGGTTVHVYAQDAVLAETVKTWIADGMRATEQAAVMGAVAAAREVVPQEMARTASNSFA